MPSRFCPHVGLRDDTNSHVDYPSYDNFCYISGERRVVSMSDQAKLCLSPRYTTCPRLVSSFGSLSETASLSQAVEEGVVPREESESLRQMDRVRRETARQEAMRVAPSPPRARTGAIPGRSAPQERVKRWPAKEKSVFCPHLGSLSGRGKHAGYPSYNHFCCASRSRQVVSMAHQNRFCLKSEYLVCPKFIAVPQSVPDVLPAPQVRPKPAGGGDKARLAEIGRVRPEVAQPIDIVAIVNLAIQGKFSEAMAETERAVEGLDSDQAKSLVWGLLVSSYSEATGDLVSDFVFSGWKRALDLDPSNFRPYYGLAFYYAGYGDYANALWAASMVLKLAPKDDPAYKGIWQFIGMAEQKIGTEAVEEYLAQ